MARLQYIVRKDEDEWTIAHGGSTFGPYYSRGCALRAAINAAEAQSRQGRRAEVVVEEGERSFVEWTSSDGPSLQQTG
jgi:hypothetical protein